MTLRNWAPAWHPGRLLRHLWVSWRSLRLRELGWFTLMGLLYGLIDLSALVYVGDDPRWLHALTRQLFSPVIVTVVLLFILLPASRSRHDHPQRWLRLVAATLLGSLAAMQLLWWLVSVLDWPAVSDLMRQRKSAEDQTMRAVVPWRAWLGDSLSAFIPSMLTVTLFELLDSRERTRLRLQQVLHEQSAMARRAMSTRLAALQAQVEPQFLFDTLVDIEQAYAAGKPEAAAQMERLIGHLRVALPRLREQGVTLEGEAALLQSYLAVLAGRHKSALQFSAHWPDSLQGTTLPPMLLLPLLQRALRLALPRLPQRCSLQAQALQGGGLRLLLALDLAGLCGDDAELRSLAERLRQLSGGPALLLCRSDAEGTLFTLELQP